MTHASQGALAPRRVIATLMLAAAALLVFAAPQAAEAKKKEKTSAMSVNLYFGADLEGALVAGDIAALKTAAGAAYNQLVASNPNKRLKAQARIIKKQDPDIVGLQEAANLFTGPEGPVATPGSATTNKEFDFIKELVKRLKKAGAPYTVANKQKNIDISVPTDLGMNVRLVDYDAILVKKDKQIKVKGKSGGNFDAGISVPIPLNAATPTFVPRGYTQANVKIGRGVVNVVNTHLEAFIEATRNAQATELVKKLKSKKPTILTGDLNSGPNSTPAAYNTVLGAGFKGVGKKQNTCCYDADLTGGSLTSQIDFVLGSKGDTKVKKEKRTGTKKPWPSDHAGWYADVEISR